MMPTWTGSIPRCHLQSQSLVCIKKKKIIAGIGTIVNKELKNPYQPDRYDRTCVYNDVSVL